MQSRTILPRFPALAFGRRESWLDLVRLFPYRDEHPVVLGLGPGGFDAAVRAPNALSDPRNTAGDQVWWN
jgi:hypothetical protein